MSTTVVAQLTKGEQPHVYAVITVREDTDTDTIEDATTLVSRHAILGEDEPVDEMEFRASLSSELKAVDLTLEALTYAAMVEIGD